MGQCIREQVSWIQCVGEDPYRTTILSDLADTAWLGSCGDPQCRSYGPRSGAELHKHSSTLYHSGGDGPGRRGLLVSPPGLGKGVAGSLENIQMETILWQSLKGTHGRIRSRGDENSSRQG